VIFHEEKAIPVSRLQHVDLTRGPIERAFGLATLVVHTAGTEAASFRLPGLTADRAGQLRDAILEARGDDTV
jgi:membrane protein YdbS with pleckstrin-like domain